MRRPMPAKGCRADEDDDDYDDDDKFIKHTTITFRLFCMGLV